MTVRPAHLVLADEVGVLAEAPDAAAAQNGVNETMQQVLDAMRALDVPDSALRTEDASLIPGGYVGGIDVLSGADCSFVCHGRDWVLSRHPITGSNTTVSRLLGNGASSGESRLDARVAGAISEVAAPTPCVNRSAGRFR